MQQGGDGVQRFGIALIEEYGEVESEHTPGIPLGAVNEIELVAGDNYNPARRGAERKHICGKDVFQGALRIVYERQV